MVEVVGADFADDLSRIGAAITEGGDILLYGCFVAADGHGQAFIDAMAGKTGADIAASIDPTGADEAGGDWVLEHATGPIAESTITALLAGSEFGGVLTGPVPMTMDFGTADDMLALNEENPFVPATASTELNGFDLTGSFRQFSGATGNGNIELATGGIDTGATDGFGRAINVLGGPDNAVLAWSDGASSPIADRIAGDVFTGTMTSSDGSTFRLVEAQFAYYDRFFADTTFHSINFFGSFDGTEVGSLIISNPDQETAITLDFTNPTTGSFEI